MGAIYTDSARLKQMIYESGLKKNYIARQLSLSPYGFAKKVDGLTEFKQSEIQRLCEILQINTLKQRQEIFFNAKVDQ